MSVHLPDFNVLLALHQHDPEALEAFRRHILREAVDDTPAAHRPALEQLLARIEAARTAALSPEDALLTAFSMMHESMSRLHAAWEDAAHTVAELQTSLLIERLRR
jgi:hypothetical protein